MRCFKVARVIEQRIGDSSGEGPWVKSAAWKKSRVYIAFEKELIEYITDPITYAAPEKYAKALYQLRKTPFAVTMLVGSKICLLPPCSRADTFRYQVRRAASDNSHGPFMIEVSYTEAYTAEEQTTMSTPTWSSLHKYWSRSTKYLRTYKREQMNKEQLVRGKTDNSMEKGVLSFLNDILGYQKNNVFRMLLK